MKYIQQIAKSSAFLIGGFVVLVLSLHFTNTQQTMAAGNSPSPTPTPASWLDSEMPGTMPYLLERVADKWKIWQKPTPNRGDIYIKHASDRMKSAEYSFSLGHEDMAMTTLKKAFGYLAKAHLSCKGFTGENVSCNDLTENFQSQIASFVTLSRTFSQEAHKEETRNQASSLYEQALLFDLKK